jgi:hypothetical protein
VLGISTTKINLGKGVSLFPFHIPSGSLRNASVCASASCLRLAALIAAKLDGPASITTRVIVMLLLMMMIGAGWSAAVAIYTPLERMETDRGMG